MKMKSIITASVLMLSAGAAIAAPAGLEIPYGGVMADGNGMSVYVFDKDKPNESVCYDDCANNWPPLMAKDGAEAEGDFTLTERTGGGYQWAYKTKPLYYWVGDSEPGDTTGDGVGDVWHVVK